MGRAPIVTSAGCVTALIGLALLHAWRVPFYAGDDQIWRAHAARGLAAVWTEPSPFSHYRPAFGTWLHVLQRLGADSPGALAVATLVLYLAGSALVLYALRPLLDVPGALAAAALFSLHPARQQQLFWTSAGIDALALVWSLLCLGLALRALRAAQVARWRYGAIALSTGLALLSKEIAGILPVLVLLLPGPASARRRLSLAAASAVGAAAAVAAWLLVIRGGGRPAGLLELAGSPTMLLYPTRLVWPGDLGDWVYRAKLGHDFFPLLAVSAISAAACAGLALAWRGRWSSPAARTGVLLMLAGMVPWLIRSDDRALGLGVAGIALLLAGAVQARPRRAAALIVILAACWLPLWLHWEARWREAARQSSKVAAAQATWRAEAPPKTFLVALGAPSMVGWTCEVIGVGETDRCSMDLFAVLGPSPADPLQLSVDGRGLVKVATTGDDVLRWGQRPAPSAGVLSVDTDHAGFTRGALLDPRVLRDVARRRGCDGVEIRRWDGGKFRP